MAHNGYLNHLFGASDGDRSLKDFLCIGYNKPPSKKGLNLEYDKQKYFLQLWDHESSGWLGRICTVGCPYVPNDCAGPNKLEGNYVIN